MANAVYDLYKQELMKGTANNLLNSAEGVTGVYCALVDTGVYTFSQAHQFYSSLAGVVGTDQEILTKTQVTGVFDGTDLTYTAVTGANTTWPLIAFIDTGVTGLPVTPTGGNIVITWSASGIFKI